jgi:hypothetical protein
MRKGRDDFSSADRSKQKVALTVTGATERIGSAVPPKGRNAGTEPSMGWAYLLEISGAEEIDSKIHAIAQNFESELAP